eukprot:TRINITY_DN19304_c0_g1_i2.p1 TRINITY_DN19304_c0_g1~~TRINITY_DN19304_c0_g1_i2.p1  ORF type:complete len:890 (+),score=184.63 TRINITY_DN19304_c0_g1_i2:49-2718(+)
MAPKAKVCSEAKMPGRPSSAKANIAGKRGRPKSTAHGRPSQTCQGGRPKISAHGQPSKTGKRGRPKSKDYRQSGRSERQKTPLPRGRRPRSGKAGASEKAAGDADDVPANHPAHTLVKLSSGQAHFRLEQAWKHCESRNPGKDSMQQEGRRWLDKAPKVNVSVSTAGSPAEASRVARRCFDCAARGGTFEEVVLLRRKLLRELKQRQVGKRKSSAAGLVEAPIGRRPKVLEQPLPIVLSTLPSRTAGHKVGPKPPEEGLRRLYDMMNARETIAKRRAAGITGAQLYEALPEELSAYFMRRSCPNVRRREDRTSRELHRLAAAAERLALCSSEGERLRLKQLLVLNYTVWRFIGGTLPFARAVGFLTDWTEAEKERVREAVREAFHAGHVQDLFCDAYEGPGKLHVACGRNCDQAKMEALLYNTGPKAVNNVEPMLTFFTLHGKLRIIDEVWRLAPEVVAAAQPDAKTGEILWQRVANVLGRAPYFGRDEGALREPTFFAKEVAQDLLDTPVFEGGRSSVADLHSFSPAGPGALLGLVLVYNLEEKPLQSVAVPMMRAILEAAPDFWEHGHPEQLELHDVQFMLCELQKLFHSHNALNGLRDYAGPPPLWPGFAASGPGLPWQQLLEDALLLHATKSVGGAEVQAAVPEEELFSSLLAWLGFPDPAQGHQADLCHGDAVRLTVPRKGWALSFNSGSKGSTFLAASASREATDFRLERRAGAGPLRFGDEVWLRAGTGAHLGLCSKATRRRARSQHLSAPTSSARYDVRRLFVLEPQPQAAAGPGSRVPCRSSVRLRAAQLWLHAPEDAGSPCTMSEAPAVGTPDLELDRSPAVVKVLAALRECFQRAVQRSLADGRLLLHGSQDDEDSKRLLRLSYPEEVRRRLVGSPTT